jgi:hypothetical protein
LSPSPTTWIVDGLVIRFGAPWPKMPFPTRMTVIRLADYGLFIHSPTKLVPSLKAEIDRLGEPRCIVAPNRLHYWWASDWQAAFANAAMFVAPKVREQAGSRINFECTALDRESRYPWDPVVSTVLVPGRYMTEAEFFHHPTRTLVLTDLIENFEASRINSAFMRFLTWVGGVRDPHGSMPRDMRMTFQQQQLKAAIEKMIDWNPERIVIAHGRWYDRNGRAELIRAFHWLMK